MAETSWDGVREREGRETIVPLGLVILVGTLCLVLVMSWGGRGWGGVVWNGDLCSQEWPEVAAKIFFISRNIFL